MANQIDQNSDNILKFRPVIEYVEPEVQPATPNPIPTPPSDLPQPNQVNNQRTQIKNFADALNLLAAAVQAKVNMKCADVSVKLDPNVDAAIVQAMARQFPSPPASTVNPTITSTSNPTTNNAAIDPTVITFSQYAQVREHIRLYACNLAANAGPSADDIGNSKQNINNGIVNIGGIGTPNADKGALRPELNDKGQVVKPLDMNKFQQTIFEILVNYIWKNFVRPVLVKILPSEISKHLPLELTKQGSVGPSSASGDLASNLRFQDSHTISKAFERGCNYSTDPNSVFAVMTPQLSTVRCSSATISDMMQNQLDTSQPPSAGEPSTPSIDPNKSSPGKLTGDGGKPQFGGWFLSNCIPCLQRPSFKVEFSNLLGQFGFSLDAIWNLLYQMLQQVRQMIDMLTGKNNYFDLCAFLKWLTTFVCIPDLYRIIAALMAFLANISISLNGAIDFIIGLIAPLFLPFFTKITDLLQQFILLAIAPLECIIKSIQSALQKLDYNVLFQNLDNVPTINLGPQVNPPSLTQISNDFSKIGNNTASSLSTVSLDNTGNFNPTSNMQPTQTPFDARSPGQAPSALSVNPADILINPVTGMTARQTAQSNQSAVNTAAASLQALNQASQNVNSADPAAVANQQAQVAAAQAKYNDAVSQARKGPSIGPVPSPEELSSQLTAFDKSLKSLLLQLVGYLQQVAAIFDALLENIFGEFKKLISMFAGQGSGFLFNLRDKAAILQLVGLVKGIIEAIKRGVVCKEQGKEIETYQSAIPRDKGINFIVNSDGSLTVSPTDASIDGPLAAVIGAGAGALPGQPFPSNGINSQVPISSSNNNSISNGSSINGINNSVVGSDIRARFKSMIPLTGNGILDTQISKTVEALINPGTVTVKCPLLTTISDATQVNQWISELNQL
jgi:hypothetical protein